jgi:DNA-binding beta-propeller fold protein YncE
LGAILYFLLAGKPPFDAEDLATLLRQILEEEPVRPSAAKSRVQNLNPPVEAVPHDLETICLKCLEKEPQRTYGSAKELADDLERFIHQQPIFARPLSRMERGWRWCNRHRVAVSAWLGLTVALAAVPLALNFRQPVQSGPARAQRAARPSYQYTGPVPTVVALDGDTLSQTSLGLGAGLAVDPKNNHLWCPILLSNAVLVRDGISGAVITNLTLADCPGAAAFDTEHRVVWVTAQCGIRPHLGSARKYPSSDLLWAIEADTYAIIEEIPSGGINGGPEAVNPGTGRFYHNVDPSHSNGAFSQRVDFPTFVTRMTGFGPVFGIDPQANLLYACDTNGSFQIIDGESDPEKIVTNVALPFTGGFGTIGVDPVLHRVYLPNTSSNTIVVLEGKTGQFLDTIVLGAGFAPRHVSSVACDPVHNRLYAVASPEQPHLSYLYVIQGAAQRVVAFKGALSGPVLNPKLNRVYVWLYSSATN